MPTQQQQCVRSAVAGWLLVGDLEVLSQLLPQCVPRLLQPYHRLPVGPTPQQLLPGPGAPLKCLLSVDADAVFEVCPAVSRHLLSQHLPHVSLGAAQRASALGCIAERCSGGNAAPPPTPRRPVHRRAGSGQCGDRHGTRRTVASQRAVVCERPDCSREGGGGATASVSTAPERGAGAVACPCQQPNTEHAGWYT